MIRQVPHQEEFFRSRIPDRPVITDWAQPHNLVNAPLVEGANRNRKGGYLNYCFIAFVDAGEVDFGENSPENMELEIAYEMSQAGIVNVYLDEICPENRLTSFFLPKRATTGGKESFRYHTAPLNRKVTGTHRVLFTADGFFTYFLRSWRMTAETTNKGDFQ